MANKYLFIASQNVGKTTILRNISKIITNMGFKVCLVDISDSQGIYYGLNVSEYETSLPIVRDGVDIYAYDYTKNINGFKYDIDETKYDVIFYETNGLTDHLEHNINNYNIVIVQDFDRRSLMKNVEVLKEIYPYLEHVPSITLIFNKILNCKLKRDYMLSEFAKVSKLFLLKAESFDIAYDDDVYRHTLNNVLSDKLDLIGYTDTYRESLYEIACYFADFHKGKYKKYVV